MKKLTTKFTAIIMVLIITITTVPIGELNVKAASPSVDKVRKMTLYEGREGWILGINIKNPVKNGKITKIKSSNPNVVRVTKASYLYNGAGYTPVGEGTAKITFTYAGKKLSTKIIVKKYVNPCKMFKIGNTDYAKNFDVSEHYNHNRRKKTVSAKIKIKPKEDWKLTKIEYVLGKKIKNNSKVKLSPWGSYGTGVGIYAYFKNKNTGETQGLYLGYCGQNFESSNEYNSWPDSFR